MEYEKIYKEWAKNSQIENLSVIVKHQEVSMAYGGAHHAKNTTVRQDETVPITLSQREINAIGDFINVEHTDAVKEGTGMTDEVSKCGT